MHVLRHALARPLLEVALHVEVVDGAADVLEDRLVAHQQVAVFEAVGDPGCMDSRLNRRNHNVQKYRCQPFVVCGIGEQVDHAREHVGLR